MSKVGNNSGKGEEVKEQRKRKGKRIRKAKQIKDLTQSPAISTRQYLQMRIAKYFVVTGVNCGSAHHVITWISLNPYGFL